MLIEHDTKVAPFASCTGLCRRQWLCRALQVLASLQPPDMLQPADPKIICNGPPFAWLASTISVCQLGCSNGCRGRGKDLEAGARICGGRQCWLWLGSQQGVGEALRVEDGGSRRRRRVWGAGWLSSRKALTVHPHMKHVLS